MPIVFPSSLCIHMLPAISGSHKKSAAQFCTAVVLLLYFLFMKNVAASPWLAHPQRFHTAMRCRRPAIHKSISGFSAPNKCKTPLTGARTVLRQSSDPETFFLNFQRNRPLSFAQSYLITFFSNCQCIFYFSSISIKQGTPVGSSLCNMAIYSFPASFL